jgi:hypothetical protein
MGLLTYLDNRSPDIVEASIDLLRDKFRWGDMYVLDTQSVLSCQSCSCCHGIASMGCEDLLISLKASALLSVSSFPCVVLYVRSAGAIRASYH